MDKKIIYVISIVAIVGMCLTAFVLISGKSDDVVLASKAQYVINNDVSTKTPQQLASSASMLNNAGDSLSDNYNFDEITGINGSDEAYSENVNEIKTNNETITWLKSLDPGEYVVLTTHNAVYLVMKHSDYNRIKDVAKGGSNITVAGYVEKNYPAIGGGIDVISLSNVELVSVE